MFGIQKFISEQPGGMDSLISPPLLYSDTALKHRQNSEGQGGLKEVPNLPSSLVIPHLWRMPEWTPLAPLNLQLKGEKRKKEVELKLS